MCVGLSRWPYRNRPDRIKPLCWTPLHLFTKARLFLSEYEFLASWCLGAGLRGQGKESLRAGDLALHESGSVHIKNCTKKFKSVSHLLFVFVPEFLLLTEFEGLFNPLSS